MDNTTDLNAPFPPPPVSAGPAPPVEQRVTEIASLLRSLDQCAVNSGRAKPKAARQENQLAQVRLGLASSLFMALRCKHAPTAAHSMRVALGCSAWALALDLSNEQRDQIEVAALLHDVGKIGVPDHILQKPGNLTTDESAVMAHHHALGLEILGCCCSQELLDSVRYAPAWYDGYAGELPLRGEDLPLGARLIAIVDAFDAMTTDHVYRRALPRERALMELYQCAGKQFDPELVKRFAALHEKHQLDLHANVSQRWLESLAPDLANRHWQLGMPEARGGQVMTQTLFQQKLLDNMHAGVAFIDGQQKIFLWNHGIERLSGIAGAAVYQRLWRPELIGLRDEHGRRVPEQDCPVAKALRAGSPSKRRLLMTGRNGAETPIDLQTIPVVGRDGTTYGATVVIHDMSSETSLEERCESLHSKATQDPLTQIANRAEFDRVHELFIAAHAEKQMPCGLIICDIDHFKQVNDTYGHQAGDEAIKSFAALLKSMGRHGDLVARYGGEEFVMLCADCDMASAFGRAEQARRALSELPMKLMGNKRITASFGVTENQPGDTPETMLRRADRALLEAKETGRNRVVQLGTGGSAAPERRGSGWWPFRAAPAPDVLLDAHLAANVPTAIAVEKLRGFVADHNAHIVRTEDDLLELAIEAGWLSLLRRDSDRPVALSLELRFSQYQPDQQTPGPSMSGTRVHVVIRPKRNRDRRRAQTLEHARNLFTSLKAYLMAQEIAADQPVLARAKKALAPWLKKK